jgi:hypothetical protein
MLQAFGDGPARGTGPARKLIGSQTGNQIVRAAFDVFYLGQFVLHFSFAKTLPQTTQIERINTDNSRSGHHACFFRVAKK